MSLPSPMMLTVLRLLIANPQGLYGSEIFHLTDGKIVRGTIYVTLNRMHELGLVHKLHELRTATYKMVRIRCTISAEGERQYKAFLAEINCTPNTEDEGWKEAAIAWEVCASIHRAWAKPGTRGKDALFTTRQADFLRHAEEARAKLKSISTEV